MTVPPWQGPSACPPGFSSKKLGATENCSSPAKVTVERRVIMPSKVLVMWCMICNPTEPAVSGKGEFQQGGEVAVSHLNGGEEDFGIPKTKSSLQDRRGIKCWIHESGSLGRGVPTQM